MQAVSTSWMKRYSTGFFFFFPSGWTDAVSANSVIKKRYYVSRPWCGMGWGNNLSQSPQFHCNTHIFFSTLRHNFVMFGGSFVVLHNAPVWFCLFSRLRRPRRSKHDNTTFHKTQSHFRKPFTENQTDRIKCLKWLMCCYMQLWECISKLHPGSACTKQTLSWLASAWLAEL